MKIISDPMLRTTPSSLGTTVADGALRAPPDLANLLARVGVRDALYLPSMLEDMPSLFIQELGLDPAFVEPSLVALREQMGLPGGATPNDFVMPPLGAMVGPAKR